MNTVYGRTHILEHMLNVSIIIPTWNEQDRITDCLDNALRQTVMPHEVIVVDNRSTDNTVAIVQQYMQEHPEAPIRLLHQDEEQGLIPTRNYGLNHATGDVLGRVDADCMLKPDWVEVVSGIFTEDSEAMGATGPVTYYDMPARRMSCAAMIPCADTPTARTAAKCCCSAPTWRCAPPRGSSLRTRCASTKRM